MKSMMIVEEKSNSSNSQNSQQEEDVNGDGERGEVHDVGRSSDTKEIQQHLDREEKLRWWSTTATSPCYW